MLLLIPEGFHCYHFFTEMGNKRSIELIKRLRLGAAEMPDKGILAEIYDDVAALESGMRGHVHSRTVPLFDEEVRGHFTHHELSCEPALRDKAPDWINLRRFQWAVGVGSGTLNSELTLHSCAKGILKTFVPDKPFKKGKTPWGSLLGKKDQSIPRRRTMGLGQYSHEDLPA